MACFFHRSFDENEESISCTSKRIVFRKKRPCTTGNKYNQYRKLEIHVHIQEKMLDLQSEIFREHFTFGSKFLQRQIPTTSDLINYYSGSKCCVKESLYIFESFRTEFFGKTKTWFCRILVRNSIISKHKGRRGYFVPQVRYRISPFYACL